MNNDQKAGALILAVAVTLIAVTLVLSQGWTHPNPNVSLYLSFQYGDGILDTLFVQTRYVLAPLVIVAGYGAIRYFSLIPPIFRRTSKPKDKET